MISWSRYTGWLLGSMMMLLLEACYNYDEDYDLPSATPKLQIHVFTPEHPVVTRASGDPVTADALEKAIHDLHIWVFESNNGTPVGYLHPTDFTNEGGTYLMDVTNEFVDRHPNVDVYVLANVFTDNCGLGLTLGEATTRDQLDGILIEHSGSNDYFGLTAPQSEVSEEYGLPMSGVLKGQVLDNSTAPVLSVGNVQVVRAVSKVRFIFSCSALANKELKIKKITLNGGILPKAEYLFLGGAYPENKYNIKDADQTSGYEDNELHVFSLKECDLSVPTSIDPSVFAYNGAVTGQAYENLINAELSKTETETVKREIVEGGRFYLRESDKMVSGKIYYTIGNDPEKSEDFSLTVEGDFTRNHTWIVYGYFAGSNNLRIFTVSFTDWETLATDPHSVYNW